MCKPRRGRVWSGMRIIWFPMYKKQNEDENEGKLKDTEVVMALFMCNINTGVCLQSFKNVLCHFEPTIYWLLSKYKKMFFYWEPQERVRLCVCIVLCLGTEEGGRGSWCSWCWVFWWLVNSAAVCFALIKHQDVSQGLTFLGLLAFLSLSTCGAACWIELLYNLFWIWMSLPALTC